MNLPNAAGNNARNLVLTQERIDEIRRLAEEQKVNGMLVQEWELVALCDHAAGAMQHGQKPFAWWRISNGQAVSYIGENPPYGEISSPLYRAPIHREHADTERFRYVCQQFDGLGDRDFHEEAAKLAGGEEPTKEHYLFAYRAIVDTIRRTLT